MNSEPQFSLRPATRQDAAAIRRLIWRVRINPTGLDWHRFIVAVDEKGALVGCGQVKPHGDATRELASIAVRPERRHEGIASAVIKRLLEDHPPPLFLTCAARLEGFYRQFGFTVLAVEQMPPELKRRWERVDWLRRRLFPTSGGMLVMGNGGEETKRDS